MRTFLIPTILFLQLGSGVAVHTGAPAGSGAPCVPPITTYRYVASNVLNTCNGGLACSNGLGVDKLTEYNSTGNDATQLSGGARPVYTTGAVNGLPAITFSGAQFLTFASGWPAGSGSITIYAVLEPGTGGSLDYNIVGSGSGGAGRGSLEWNVQQTSYEQYVNASTETHIGGGSTALSTSHFSTIVFVYNFSSGAYTFYVCSGGTCNVDSSGTTTASSWLQASAIGLNGNDSTVFYGQIAELGYLNSANISGIDAWTQCEYGIG